MSGIAGIVRFDNQPIDRGRLKAILGHLRHLGPDGEGIHEYDNCAFVAARLSVIDPTQGIQPMNAPETGDHPPLTVVLNGEIYNHRDLRKRLERFGHVFQTDHSDTEVLLHGFRQWGTDLPKHLRGMFAFAIWNVRDEELFLCRDQTGRMPLYIHQRSEGEQIRRLIFGNVVATIIAAAPNEQMAISRESTLTFLRFGTTHHASLIDRIEEIGPAHWMKVHSDGRFETERYWRPPAPSRTGTKIGLIEGLESTLAEAVRSRLDADVPLGCWITGGVDSSTIATIANRELKQRDGEPLRTFSVSIPDLEFDDSKHAAEVAKQLGTNHTELVAEANDVIADLEHLIKLSGEPIADHSVLTDYWAFQALRNHIKVALCGEGGDEIFGGYDRYRAMSLIGRHQWLLKRMPAPVLALYESQQSEPGSLKRLIDAAGEIDAASQYHRMINLFTDDEIRQLGFDPQTESDASPAILPDWPVDIDPVHAAMRWDLTHTLPFDLLRRIDRASMGCAIEVRCPMLDTRVCELASHLPPNVLLPHNRPKGLLRQLATQLLPKEFAQRPKHDVSIPMGTWFTEHLRQPLADRILDGHLGVHGIDRSAVEKLFDQHMRHEIDHTHKLFALLSLSIWTDWIQN